MQTKGRGHRLGGARSPEIALSPEQRLERLEKSVAFGGRHVPVPKTGLPRPVQTSERPRARFRSVLDLGSKLNNETISTKSKKLYPCLC